MCILSILLPSEWPFHSTNVLELYMVESYWKPHMTCTSVKKVVLFVDTQYIYWKHKSFAFAICICGLLNKVLHVAWFLDMHFLATDKRHFVRTGKWTCQTAVHLKNALCKFQIPNSSTCNRSFFFFSGEWVDGLGLRCRSEKQNNWRSTCLLRKRSIITIHCSGV